MTEGPVALVTGASRGIGRATALLLAERGFSLVLSGRTASEALAAAAAAVATVAGAEPLVLPMDVASPEQVAQAFRALFATHKRLDALVNNAGFMETGRLGMVPAATVNRLLAVNTAGAVHVLQAAARLMARRRSGAVVNVTSVVGLQGAAGNAVYAASKAALVGLTRSAAKELGPQGIRVNAVAPGFVDTDLTAGFSAEERAAVLQGVALGRAARPLDVARVVAFLVSEDATYVTGQVLGVDGGMVV